MKQDDLEEQNCCLHWGDFRPYMVYNGTVQTQNKIDSAGLLSGYKIFGKSKADLLALVEKRLNNKNELVTIATPNPEQLVLAHHDRAFKGYLDQFDLLLPDGQGLVWASRLLADKYQREPYVERIAGREVVAFILSQAQRLQLKVLIVGGRGYEGGVISSSMLAEGGSSVECLVMSVNQVQLESSQISQTTPFKLYWSSAYQNVAEPTVNEQHQLEAVIQQLQPDVVLVAFGAPYQEGWILRHSALLEQSGVRLAMVVGGSFDYLLGKVPAVPKIVSQLGVEWLFRLISQPWRWKRQLKLLEFISLILREMMS